MNTFMNFANRFLAKEETRVGVRASERVGASPLLALDFAPVSLFCSLEILAGGLT